MGARWEVALPWTMVSAARCENRVRATTRLEASAQGRHTLTLLPPLLMAPAAQLPESGAEGVLAQVPQLQSRRAGTKPEAVVPRARRWAPGCGPLERQPAGSNGQWAPWHSPALEARYWAWPSSRALTALRAAWALLTR